MRLPRSKGHAMVNSSAHLSAVVIGLGYTVAVVSTAQLINSLGRLLRRRPAADTPTPCTHTSDLDHVCYTTDTAAETHTVHTLGQRYVSLYVYVPSADAGSRLAHARALVPPSVTHLDACVALAAACTRLPAPAHDTDDA